MKQNDLFLRLIDSGSKSLDVALRYALQKEMIKEQLLSDAEINRIAELVLRRIHITVDASQVVNEIDAIKKAIDNLGKRG